MNASHKTASLSVALAFPDVYEVGMSHLGLKILYDIINSLPYASAERVFHPWLDLGAHLGSAGIPLASLESRRPLKDFDVVGFSLQYELSYTAVLNMLSLSGIPLRTGDRLNEGRSPLVIAGGPCTVNPMPMAPFIDAFLIGDGEEAVPEILGVCHEWKIGGGRDRHALLKALSKIEGVFVPLLGTERPVLRRYVSSLEDAPFPVAPVVPYTSIIHDRVNIEISRGCPQGCRFCQAGMIYRPVRERSPEKVIELAERSLQNTGFDSASFTSLSSGDYPCLVPLMREFNRRFSSKRISLSLPSLRVASVNDDMLQELRAVRKSGFTIAPEAGTDRLRAVINKDVSSEMYSRALDSLFRAGWQNLKLYFMTGLPTETEEDIKAIPAMVLEALRTSKRLTGRNVSLSVGIASFVPKPHTPFQWFGQNPLGLLKEKNAYLKREFLRRGVQYRGHTEEMSLLEAALSRGDESLAPLIEAAWSKGCTLDAWTEAFDFGRWLQAMESTGIHAASFAEKTYDESSSLPWESIHSGVSKEFLWEEYQKALKAEFSPDCRRQCLACGLDCGPDIGKDQEPGQEKAGAPLREGPVKRKEPPALRFRVEFSKTGVARYLSHLELTTALIRAMRRAGFPFRYSEGFHPSPRFSSGPALSVGVAGLKEYFDIEVCPPFDPVKGLRLLRETLPEGLGVSQLAPLYGKTRSLNSFVSRYRYEIRHTGGFQAGRLASGQEISVSRKDTVFDLREMIEDFEEIDDFTVRLTLRDRGDLKVRLDEVMEHGLGVSPDEAEITRLGMFGWDGGWQEPIAGHHQWAARS